MQRIAYGELKGYLRIQGIETSLRSSKLLTIQELVRRLDANSVISNFALGKYRNALIVNATRTVVRAKKIKESSHHAFVDCLNEAIETIWTVKALTCLVSNTRLIKYEGDNILHEQMLLEIWDGLMEPEKLSGIYTRQWQIIGFQGMHPETDFRGAGLLSLECFHYLVMTYRDQSKQLLSHSQHPQYDYPLACVLIDMTFFCYQLLSDGKANTHFYNRCTAFRALNRELYEDLQDWQIDMRNIFYDFVAAVLIEFDQFWITSHPRDILDYGKVKKDFHEHVFERLSQPDCFFHVKYQQI
ncbi:unnamed protein product [Allacma fusca]|uniref:ELMO domain-containing protein n=1 Tax=Allacma fusca TaxID=39272 RepID=A0A8J2J4E0_9HEXA|nr:unnamed protein product [Allacma fusca]